MFKNFLNTVLYFFLASDLANKIFKSSKMQKSKSRLLRKIFFRAQNRIKTIYISSKKTFFVPNIDSSAEKGVNIIGFMKYDVGLAEGARAMVRSFEAVGVDVCAINDARSKHPMSNDQVDHLLTNNAKFNVNIFANNLDISFKSRKKLDIPDSQLLSFGNKYNINYGYWEFSKLPDAWIEMSDRFDEIWAPTRFVGDIFSKNVKTNVVYMPQAVDFVVNGSYGHEYFKLPKDKFLFMFSFDLFSYDSRKNSGAVIKAFKKAFSQNDKNVCLIIKTNGSTESDAYAQRLQGVIDNLNLPSHQIVHINSNMSRDEMYGLISLCDCYVSLHRTEGLGLGMAEAMKLGKPVIATNYSGNTDFMNHQNSCLVDYKLITAKKSEYEFLSSDSVWAEPDIDNAAYYMKKIFDEAEYRNKKAILGKKFIDDNYNLKVVGEIYKNRLQLLGLI